MTDHTIDEEGRSRPARAAPRWARPLVILDGAIARLEAAVLALGVLGMATISVANVIGRFLFGTSIFFTAEVNQFLVVLITFFGVGYAARHGRHIRMTAIYDELPHRPRKALQVAICLVTAGAMFVLAWYAWIYVSGLMATGRIAPALGVPIWLPLVWTPIGFAITGLQYLLTAGVNLVEREVYISTTVSDAYDDDQPEHV